jgi:radical SAM-linked protein
MKAPPITTAVTGRAEPPVRHRVRIRFAKKGRLRFLGHRDLVRALERLFRRANLRLGMTQGFHPKPRMTFPLALGLGIDGLEEVMELELAEQLSPEEVLARLRQHAIEGLEFLSVSLPGSGAKNKVKVKRVVYSIMIPPERREEASLRLKELLERPDVIIRRPKKGTEFNLKDTLDSLEIHEGILDMTLRQRVNVPDASPRDILRELELEDIEKTSRLVRRRVEVEGEPKSSSPVQET